MNIIKGFLAGAVFFFSLAVLLVAQSITGVSVIGVKLGAQGGSGDVSSNTTSNIDGEVALFGPGTNGKGIRRATGSGLATLSSGVLGTQTPGTVGNCTQWAAGGLLADAGSPCGSGGGSYAAGDGINGTSLSSSTIAVDATVPALAAEGSQSLTFNGGSAMASGSCYTQSITASGAQVGDKVSMSWPATIASGLSRSATVTAMDTISVELCKISSGTATVSGLTFAYQIMRTR